MAEDAGRVVADETTDNTNYCILLASESASSKDYAYKSADLTFNPATSRVTASDVGIYAHDLHAGSTSVGSDGIMFYGGDCGIDYGSNDESVNVYGDAVSITASNIALSGPATAASTFTVSSPYITVNGVRVYVSATAPSGSIPTGSLGIGW